MQQAHNGRGGFAAEASSLGPGNHFHISDGVVQPVSVSSLETCRPCLTVGEKTVFAPVCAAGLLDLPVPILQYVLVSAGPAGAVAANSCSTLRSAFTRALACPVLAARFLIARHGHGTALFHVYGSPEIRKGLLRACHRPDDAAAAVGFLVQELLALGAALKPQARFLLASASACGDARVVRTLLRAGVDAVACGGRALVAASAAGHVAVMELLLRAGVSSRAENGMPLRTACREGQVAAARLLLAHGADPRAAASAALAEASRGGHLALVLELLAAGADARVDGSRALVEAAAAGHGYVVLALLVAGAQPNARNGLAIRQAEIGGHLQVARILQSASAVAMPAGPVAQRGVTLHGVAGGDSAADCGPRSPPGNSP